MQDIIERDITLKAPIDRVWAAITDYREFGTWFRVVLDGPFALGLVTTGKIAEPGYEGLGFWAVTVEMAPWRFGFDWPADPAMTPDQRGPGKTTRVTFDLTEVADGTRVVIRESGFAALPGDLGPQKLRDNDRGWVIQAERIKAHVGG